MLHFIIDYSRIWNNLLWSVMCLFSKWFTIHHWRKERTKTTFTIPLSTIKNICTISFYSRHSWVNQYPLPRLPCHKGTPCFLKGPKSGPLPVWHIARPLVARMWTCDSPTCDWSTGVANTLETWRCGQLWGFLLVGPHTQQPQLQGHTDCRLSIQAMELEAWTNDLKVCIIWYVVSRTHWTNVTVPGVGPWGKGGGVLASGPPPHTHTLLAHPFLPVDLSCPPPFKNPALTLKGAFRKDNIFFYFFFCYFCEVMIHSNCLVGKLMNDKYLRFYWSIDQQVRKIAKEVKKAGYFYEIPFNESLSRRQVVRRRRQVVRRRRQVVRRRRQVVRHAPV